MKISLKDITLLITDGKHGDCQNQENSGYYFISCKDVYEGEILYEEARQITKEDFHDTNKRTRYEPLDILITNSGTIGRMAIAKEIPETRKTTFQKSVAIIKPNKEKVFPHYLYYHLMHDIEKLVVLANGAAQKNLLLKDLRSIKLDIPSFPIQIKIAEILKKYDEKIINNKTQIKLLKELSILTFYDLYSKITKGLKNYKEYKIGSKIKYEIGGGWGEDIQSNGFSESAYVIRGTDMDDIPYGKIQDVPFRFHKKSNLTSRKLQDGDIIFEVSGGSHNEGVAKTLLITTELLNQFDNDVMCASFCKLARPAKRELSYFLFLFLQFLREVKGTEVFEIRSASNIVNYNWTAFLKFQKVKLPDDKTIEKFNEIIDPIYKQIYNLGHQNQLLKEARDILLPRLMTGMIEV